MHYAILGPLEVRDVALGQGRQRLLLAVLLLNRNEVLSSERLIESLWGEVPPPTAAGSLHNLVSALRKALGNGALVTHGHGYALTVGPASSTRTSSRRCPRADARHWPTATPARRRTCCVRRWRSGAALRWASWRTTSRPPPAGWRTSD